MEDPRVVSLDLVTSRWHSSVEQGPRVPCSDLKDDGDTSSDVVRFRCNPAYLGVSEVPWVDGAKNTATHSSSLLCACRLVAIIL